MFSVLHYLRRCQSSTLRGAVRRDLVIIDPADLNRFIYAMGQRLVEDAPSCFTGVPIAWLFYRFFVSDVFHVSFECRLVFSKRPLFLDHRTGVLFF